MASGAAGHFGVSTSMDAGPIVRGLNQIDRASQNTARQLQGINNTTRQLTTGLANVFNRPAQQLIFLGLDLQQLGRSLAVVGGATIAAGAASTKFAIDFGNALANINALAQLTDKQLLVLGDRIRTLATDPQVLQGPTELANAFQFLISSGFSVANGLSVLRVASIGATAGNADLETTTRALASTLNALPRGTITAQKAIDILFETVDKGIITFDELTSSMGEVLGAVGATGISFEEFGAAVSILTRAGIPASESMTSLNRVLLSFIAPTTEAKDTAKQLGIEFDLQSLRTKGFAQSLTEIAAAAGGNTETLNKLFGDIRATRGVLALAGDGVDEFITLLDSQKKATEGLGAANAALEEQLKAPGAAFKLLQRDVEAAGIAISEEFVPFVLQATRLLRDLVAGFADLPSSVQGSVFIIGGLVAGLGGLAFVAGTTATAIGALKNFFNTIGSAASGASGGIRITTQAMREQALAAEAAALANTALARSLGAVGAAGAASAAGVGARAANLGLALPIGAQTAANAAMLKTTQATQQVGTAATASALSFGRLLGLVGQATIWLTLAGVIAGAANALSDFAIDAITAGRSTEDLGRRLDELSKPREFNFLESLSRGGLQGLGTDIGKLIVQQKELAAVQQRSSQPETEPQFVQRFQRQLDLTEEAAKSAGQRQADIARAAAEQAADAQIAAFSEAQEKFPQVVENFKKAISGATSDPELEARLQGSLNRLLVEGPSALLESGFLQLSPAQKAAIVNRLNFREELAQQFEKQGNQAAADFQRGLNDELQKAIGFEHGVAIDIQADFAPAITAAENEVRRLEQNLADAVAPGEKALKGLEAAQKAARIEQLQLNLAMQDAQRAFRVAQEAVKAVEEQIKALDEVIRDLEDQFQEAQGRLSNLGQTQEIGVRFVLQGLPEIENAIFNISQQIAGINLEILNVQSGFTPEIFDAQEEVLRTRLALLKAGDAAEDLGKKASFGIDDLISAQQRELREGVPVLRTIFDKIRAASEGEGGQEDSPEEKANKDAQKRLEILQIEQQLATIQLQKQLEIAQQEERRLQLTKQITFDPQIRDLEQLATITKEVTFEEAKAGILAAREEMTTLRQRIEEAKDEQKGLNDQLAAANDILAGRQAVVDSLSAAQGTLQQRMTQFQLDEALILERQAAIQETFNQQIKDAQAHVALIEQQSRAQAPSPMNTPSDPSTWSSDVGNDYPIPFSTEQQQQSNTDIRAIQQNTVASLQAVDAAAGGIAGIFLRLLEALGAPIAQNAGQVQFHEGGKVLQGLTPGIEVPARLLVGEHVLSRGQVHVLRSAGIDPSHVHELVGAIRSLPRYHEGGPVAMVSAPAIAPMSSALQALPSGGQNWNWAVTIHNSGGGDVYGKFMREVYSRRLGGRWR